MHPALITALENIACGWITLPYAPTFRQKITARFILNHAGA